MWIFSTVLAQSSYVYCLKWLNNSGCASVTCLGLTESSPPIVLKRELNLAPNWNVIWLCIGFPNKPWSIKKLRHFFSFLLQCGRTIKGKNGKKGNINHYFWSNNSIFYNRQYFLSIINAQALYDHLLRWVSVTNREQYLSVLEFTAFLPFPRKYNGKWRS